MAGRIPELDGLRGAAILAVVVAHGLGEPAHGARLLAFAWLGVDLFFVLSGFLIGGILLENRGRQHYFSTFYIRRAFRIFPIYYLAVGAVLALLAALPGLPAAATDGPLPAPAYASYTQNLAMAWLGRPGSAWLLPTWTLAVEEQFYWLLPVMIHFLAGRRLLLAIGLVILSAPLVRLGFLLGPAGHRLGSYVLLPSRWDLLFLGVLAAYVRGDPRLWARATAAQCRALKAACLAGAGAMALAALAERASGLPVFHVAGEPFVGAGCAAFLLLLVAGAPEARRFRFRPLRGLGIISYCLYLIHQPVIGLLHALVLGGAPDVATWPQLAVTLAGIALSVALAWLSWTVLEGPLLRLGHGWSYGAAPARAAAPAEAAPARQARGG